MQNKNCLAQYCENSILEIPKALFDMRDVKPILHSDESSVFYKDLDRDLINIEFHTSVPCLVYIKSGKETITTSDNESYNIGPGEAVFLPKGLNLYSDYIHEEDGLKAYLVFFGSEVLSRFLSHGPMNSLSISNQDAILKVEIDNVVAEYFVSLHSIYGSLNNLPHIGEIKLLELLYLLDVHDDGNLKKSLIAVQRGRAKRNIKRLMDQYALSGQSASELAALSGRSISTFNREFKALYGTTPKQWLIEQRISHAHALLAKQWSVTATAIEVGYSNVSHFISAFKKMYGMTPQQMKDKR
ncbi:MAG: AraC family transcriptional regulator [Candidatus Thiodiazotropha sp. 6PLUC2]